MSDDGVPGILGRGDDGPQLVLPFVATRDFGGPYDGPSFVAGCDIGGLDLRLAMLAALSNGGQLEWSPAFPWKRTLLEQIDLIAMRHGWTTTLFDPEPDEIHARDVAAAGNEWRADWQFVQFTYSPVSP